MEAGMLPQPTQTPEEMPELQRELTILAGASQGMLIRAKELHEKLLPIIRQYPESADRTEPGKDSAFPTYTPLGNQMRQIYSTMQEAEDIISTLIHRAGV